LKADDTTIATTSQRRKSIRGIRFVRIKEKGIRKGGVGYEFAGGLKERAYTIRLLAPIEKKLLEVYSLGPKIEGRSTKVSGHAGTKEKSRPAESKMRKSLSTTLNFSDGGPITGSFLTWSTGAANFHTGSRSDNRRKGNAFLWSKGGTGRVPLTLKSEWGQPFRAPW